MKKIFFLLAFLATVVSIQAQSTATIGVGSSSSSTRGPFQRSSASSSSVFSRANLVYTQAELAAAGILNGSVITQVNWDLQKTNIITASGDATLKVYMRNTTATGAVADTWTNIISGSTLVGNYTFNTTNNFPGVKGFMPFPLSGSGFVYTGGALEIAVDWDCSTLVPVDPAAPNQLFDGDGSLTWRWSPTSNVSITNRAGSSGPPSNITTTQSQRADIQFIFTAPAGAPVTCTNGTGTSASSTRGPIQRSSAGSSSVFSRNHHIYTAAELAACGILPGATISELYWDLRKTNVITASGDATMEIYLKNSSLTQAVSNSWNNIIAGATSVALHTFNTTNNFPGVQGWMLFTVAPFVYTGGTLEIAIDWDCSQLVPVDPTAPNQLFDGDGSLTWRWSATSFNSITNRAGSSGPPSTISTVQAQRANIQITYANPVSSSPCTYAINNTSSNMSLRLFSKDATTGVETLLIGEVIAGSSYSATHADGDVIVVRSFPQNVLIQEITVDCATPSVDVDACGGNNTDVDGDGFCDVATTCIDNTGNFYGYSSTNGNNLVDGNATTMVNGPFDGQLFTDLQADIVGVSANKVYILDDATGQISIYLYNNGWYVSTFTSTSLTGGSAGGTTWVNRFNTGNLLGVNGTRALVMGTDGSIDVYILETGVNSKDNPQTTFHDGPLAGANLSSATYLGATRNTCLLYTSPSPRDQRGSRMPSSA